MLLPSSVKVVERQRHLVTERHSGGNFGNIFMNQLFRNIFCGLNKSLLHLSTLYPF